MADTIHVVRVERTDYTTARDGIDFVTADAVAYQIVGADVIELTEERVRRHTEGVGWERRLVSEWEATDAAS